MNGANRSLQFSRKAHFQNDELRNLRPFYKDYLPTFEQVLESVFIRQGIPEYGAVMWGGRDGLHHRRLFR